MAKYLRRKHRPTKVDAPESMSAGTDLSWLDHYRESDVDFKAKVDEHLNKLRQWLVGELRSIRRRENISQGELARLTRLSQPYIAKLESGAVPNPELKTLARIATALDRDLTVMLTEPTIRSRPNAVHADVLRI